MGASFDTVMAGINSGQKTHWYKCDEASGNLADAGLGNKPLGAFNGSGSLTYEVTGSEESGTAGKGISFPHDRSVGTTNNNMGGASVFSMHIAIKTINAAANMDSVSAKFFGLGDGPTGAPRFEMSANRNADSNGNMRIDCSDGANGTDTLLDSADHPGAWDDDNWHYYVIVQRGDGNGMQFYIDGQLVTQTNRVLGTGSLDDGITDVGIGNTDEIHLGAAADNGHQLKMEAVADNWVLWNEYALTAQEVLDLFGGSTSVPINSFTRRTGRRTFNDLL